jgi:hypothetical protein
MHLLRLRDRRAVNQFMNVLDLLNSPHSSNRRRVWCDRFLKKLNKARKVVARG